MAERRAMESFRTQTAASRTARAQSRDRWLRLVADKAQQAPVPRRRSEALSRALNFSLSLAALLLIAPIMLLIAIAVKFSSRGPVFYTQTRIGLDRRWMGGATGAGILRREHDLGGRVFTIYKFRTMCVNAEHLSGAVWAAKEDPRVTAMGRVLRQYRLDELPQLFNVLLGDMNIVGPRPERPSIFAQLRQDIPEYEYRQRVKPGITGLAQVNQQYDQCIDDVRKKLEFDLLYLQRQGLWEDIKIMLKTVPVVLFKRGGW
jgi:lipopolysaccharide/colanic/teichoic acid biosynthesis glycosyltransferase